MRKILMRIGLCTAAALWAVFWSGAAIGQSGADYFSPYISEDHGGWIDWDNGVIYGVGKGYLDLNGGSKQRAFRAAQALALQSILKQAAGIQIDDRNTIQSFGGGRVVVQLRGLIRFEEHGRRFVSGAGRPHFEVTRRADLHGVEGLTAKLLDHFKSKGLPWTAFPEPASSSAAPSHEADEEETWLVLDARHLARDPARKGVQPALFPKVLSASGTEPVYDLTGVDQAAFQQGGMARYVVSDAPADDIRSDRDLMDRIMSIISPDEAFAGEKKRRKRRKLIVKKVQDAEGLARTNLVISDADARELKSSGAASKMLKKCRVIVVVNSAIGGIEGALPLPLAANGS